jgi:light-regulated signal transduction histidine kinase (bacteriophytochrome)
MGNASHNRMEEEVESLRRELDAEAGRSLELQRRLDRANAEFDEFVSTAAHNLREPLREIASFSQLMAETYGSRLDSDAGHFLDRIQQGAARMQSLLSGMVDYCGAAAGDRQSALTDMEAALQQALLCADKQLTERSASVTHDPLPPVMGDFELLTKVLLHLVRNAIEYCGAYPPRIHISSRKEGHEWVFSVQDNGPGIDAAFRERVFGAFKRLHGREHAGNGLGLAFCKKAIEWHGGRIWAAPAPEAGSVFFFTLPSAD